MRWLLSKGRFILAGGILPGADGEYDKLSKDTPTYKEWVKHKKDSNETGLDRLKEMFQVE